MFRQARKAVEVMSKPDQEADPIPDGGGGWGGNGWGQRVILVVEIQRCSWIEKGLSEECSVQ